MIDLDEERPKAPAAPNLEQMGISELEEFIQARKADIALAEQVILRKKAAKETAQKFFKD